MAKRMETSEDFVALSSGQARGTRILPDVTAVDTVLVEDIFVAVFIGGCLSCMQPGSINRAESNGVLLPN
jgi:hypothetical protein